MNRLSGDQNGSDAPPVSGSGTASKVFSGRIQSTSLPSLSPETKATRLPSGETAMPPALSWRPKLVAKGGSIRNRTTGASTELDGEETRRATNATAAAVTATAAATPHRLPLAIRGWLIGDAGALIVSAGSLRPSLSRQDGHRPWGDSAVAFSAPHAVQRVTSLIRALLHPLLKHLLRKVTQLRMRPGDDSHEIADFIADILRLRYCVRDFVSEKLAKSSAKPVDSDFCGAFSCSEFRCELLVPGILIATGKEILQ